MLTNLSQQKFSPVDACLEAVVKPSSRLSAAAPQHEGKSNFPESHRVWSELSEGVRSCDDTWQRQKKEHAFSPPPNTDKVRQKEKTCLMLKDVGLKNVKILSKSGFASSCSPDLKALKQKLFII